MLFAALLTNSLVALMGAARFTLDNRIFALGNHPIEGIGMDAIKNPCLAF